MRKQCAVREDVLADAREFVPDACWDAFARKIRERYNT